MLNMEYQRVVAGMESLNRAERQLLLEEVQEKLADEPCDDFTPEQRAEIAGVSRTVKRTLSLAVI